MYHYGPDGYFDAYYADLALAIEAQGPKDAHADPIVLPRILQLITGASVLLSALIILIHVV